MRCCLTIIIQRQVRILKRKNPVPPGGNRPIHARLRIGANTIRPVWPIRGENQAFSIIRKQQSKTSRTGKRAIQLAGSAVEGSLGLTLLILTTQVSVLLVQGFVFHEVAHQVEDGAAFHQPLLAHIDFVLAFMQAPSTKATNRRAQ